MFSIKNNTHLKT